MSDTFAPNSEGSRPRLDQEALRALFSQARTANSFDGTPVSDDELRQIWDSAKWGPTSTNIQPLRVLYVTSGEGRSRLAAQMNENNRAKTASAPAVAVLALDSRFHEYLPELIPFRPEAKAYFEPAEVRLSAAQFNAALQAGYFIMAVRAHGLAAGPMGGFDRAGVDQEFFPDGRWRSILVVNIGHPGKNAWRPRLPRLDHEAALRWA